MKYLIIVASNIIGVVFGFVLAAILTAGSDEDDWMMYDDEDIL